MGSGELSQLLLGFLATEVVPLANRLAELGIDPTPLFATTSGILRLYADTLEHPTSPVTSRPGLAARAELLSALDGLAAGGDAELAVDRHRLGLDRVLDTYSRWPISRKVRWVGSSGSSRSSAVVSEEPPRSRRG